jgi:hypothetical protein
MDRKWKKKSQFMDAVTITNIIYEVLKQGDKGNFIFDNVRGRQCYSLL